MTKIPLLLDVVNSLIPLILSKKTDIKGLTLGKEPWSGQAQLLLGQKHSCFI